MHAQATLVGLGFWLLAAAAQAQDDDVTIRRFYEEVINQNQLELADRFFAADAVEHEPMNGPDLPAAEQFKAAFRQMRIGFPDLHFQIDDVLKEGDKVVVRFRMQGTHRGVFAHLTPTGKSIDLPGVDFFRLIDGHIVEHWGFMDSALLRHQLKAP